MPTYEYVCKECGEHLEAVQSFDDPPLSTCEACGGPLRKVFGNVGIVFKGSGFYKTDSRSTSSASAGPSGSSGSSGSGGGDGGSAKAETASAPKEGGASSAPAAAATTGGTTGGTTAAS